MEIELEALESRKIGQYRRTRFVTNSRTGVEFGVPNEREFGEPHLEACVELNSFFGQLDRLTQTVQFVGSSRSKITLLSYYTRR